MEILDVSNCQSDRVLRLPGQFSTRLLSFRRDRQKLRHGAVDAQRLLGQRFPATRADIADNRVDGIGKIAVIASRWSRQRRFA